MGCALLWALRRADQALPEKCPARAGESERRERAAATAVQLRLSMATESLSAHGRYAEINFSPRLSPDEQTQKLRVGKFSAGAVAHHDKVHRGNHVEPLITGTDARDKIAGGVSAKHRARPIL